MTDEATWTRGDGGGWWRIEDAPARGKGGYRVAKTEVALGTDPVLARLAVDVWMAARDVLIAQAEAERAEASRLAAVDALRVQAVALWGDLRSQTRFLKVRSDALGDGPCYAIRWHEMGTVTIDVLPSTTIVIADES